MAIAEHTTLARVASAAVLSGVRLFERSHGERDVAWLVR